MWCGTSSLLQWRLPRIWVTPPKMINKKASFNMFEHALWPETWHSPTSMNRSVNLSRSAPRRFHKSWISCGTLMVPLGFCSQSLLKRPSTAAYRGFGLSPDKNWISSRRPYNNYNVSHVVNPIALVILFTFGWACSGSESSSAGCEGWDLAFAFTFVLGLGAVKREIQRPTSFWQLLTPLGVSCSPVGWLVLVFKVMTNQKFRKNMGWNQREKENVFV